MGSLLQEHFLSLLQQFQQKRSAGTDNGSLPTTMDQVMVTGLAMATELVTAKILDTAMELAMDMGLVTAMDTTLGTAMDTILAMAMELAMDMGLVTAMELGMATELGTAMDTTLATATATAKLLTSTNNFSLQPKLSISIP